MGKPGKTKDLRGCVTCEELAQLFDKAFAMWQACRRDPEGRRLSPRIPTGLHKPIFVDSYEYEGRRTTLNRRARLVDVSADGLGMKFSESLPIGAVLRFALEAASGERSHGLAAVISSAKCEDSFRIGLIFTDSAQNLDVEQTTCDTETASSLSGGWRGALERIRQAAEIALNKTQLHELGHRELRSFDHGRAVVFVVNARLFRYTASIFVDGRRVAHRCGVLRDRARNLFVEIGRATVTYLEGGGYYASATMQPNNVTDCTLEVLPRLMHVSFPPIPDVPIPPPSDQATPLPKAIASSAVS